MQWGTQYAVGVGAKRSNQWMQYVVHSGIVVYGGEDIVFGAKRSEDIVDVVCSRIVVYGGGDIVFGAIKVKPEDTVDPVCSTQLNSGILVVGTLALWCKKVKPVDAVCSGIVVYGGGDYCLMVQKGQTRGCSGCSGILGIWCWAHCDFGAKSFQTRGCSGCSTQWNSGIWWWGHCLWCKKVKPFGCSMQYTVE